ncbi:hypothetical protein CHUAL_011821 [Chamberlinius hualienensis]
MSDLKHVLRKLEFPGSARDALIRLEKLCFNPSVQHQRLIQEVIEEFVFCEIDRRGIKKKRLSAVQDFQLVEVVLNYLETRESDVVRNTAFLTLFNCDKTATSKINILSKLVSTAISVKCSAVLDCSAVWMQQQSCTAEVVIFLAQELCITSWVKDDSRLCSAPLIANLQNSLPKGSIVMPPRVPILGLIRWSIEAPLEYNKNGESNREKFNELYSRLHLGVLETMAETRMFADKTVQKGVIPIRDLIVVCEDLWNIINKLDFVQFQENINLSLDRLGQALQVALSTEYLRGNMADLKLCLQKLPNNRLVQMVIAQR